jgi:glycosyltransferase involved in cell wall biosynthesis
MNHYLCLPNKLFQYVQAGLPIVVSDLPEMSSIVRHYELGKLVPPGHVSATAAAINSMLRDSAKLRRYRENAHRAALELNWETEQMKLVAVYGGSLRQREGNRVACA